MTEMKKFLAIVLALVFALSAATTAFAVANTCPYCSEVIEKEADYNTHISSKCLVKYPPKKCPDCGAQFQDYAQYDIHVEKCPEHEETIQEKLEEVIASIDFEAIFAKVKDAVSGIDFEGIIAKITPVLEQIFTYIKDAIGSVEA